MVLLIALILGLPHETKQSIAETTKWLDDNWRGEAFDLVPLEIPIDDHINKLSRLSKDWDKYGYTEMDEGYIRPDQEPLFNRGYGRVNLEWQNPHMDVKWARQFSQEFHEQFEPHVGINPWILDMGQHCLGLTLEETLKIKQTELTEHAVWSTWVERVKTYKAKKLGTTIDQLTFEIPRLQYYGGL